MQSRYFQETELEAGAEFDACINGRFKTMTVKDIVPTEAGTLQIDAEDEDGNQEVFFDIPLAFIR